MTPIRFAALVLTVALLLPISPEAKAITVLPDSPLAMAPAQALDVHPAVTVDIPAPAGGTVEVPAATLLSRQKVNCGCLYLDWWYETPGMWVSVETDRLPEI